MMNDQEGLDLSWLTEGPTSLPELMDSVHRGANRLHGTIKPEFGREECGQMTAMTSFKA